MTFAKEMADGTTTFEPYEPQAESPDRSLLGSRSQLSSPHAFNADQNTNRSVEDLDRTIASAKVPPHHASGVPTTAKYYSWDVEHKRLATDQSPLFGEISSGASGFGIRRDEHDMLVENMHLVSRTTTPQLARIEEGHEEEGSGGDHNQCGLVFFNEYGRLRVQTKLLPLRNLVGDKSVIDGDNCEEVSVDRAIR